VTDNNQLSTVIALGILVSVLFLDANNIEMFSKSTLVALCLTVAAGSSVAAFTSTPAFAGTTTSTRSPTSSSSALYISSWGTKGPPYRSGALDSANPADKVQAYLKEPEAVEARVNIDGTVLVSGLIKPGVTSDDQFLFDLLNHQDSAFEFDTIVAFVNDAKAAKKRLLSRSARYTGLLDKLEFVQAPEADALPTAADLVGVKSWLAYLQGDSMLADVTHIASVLSQGATTVENVAILLTGANELDVAASAAALEALKAAQGPDSKLKYTLVAVGKIEDHPEGQAAYMFEPFGTTEGVLPQKAIFSRQESYRMITELLQLECGVDKALCFAEVYNENATEYKLVKGLRGAGYARPQEVDHMVREGPKVCGCGCGAGEK
jgi:hypothetical protein